MLPVHLNIIRVHEVTKGELLFGLCKKYKNDAKIRFFTRHLFVFFLHRPQKLSFYYEIKSDDIECGDIQGKFFLQIF
jgi:hypothetical protein